MLTINAENAIRDYEKGIVELSGNVQIFYKQQYISCDRAMIDEKTKTIEATGNLVISSAQTYIEGDHAFLNYEENTGLIENGFVKSGQVIFEGKILKKIGPDTYESEQSSYTACTTCPTAWTFTGTRMLAEMGSYAYIRNPIMKIANVPMLWLPYLIIPLKSERQTGLLIPSIESKDNDLILGPKFFWAINRSQDALFTMKYYPQRGFKLLTEYNYILSNDSYGFLNIGAMGDRLFERDPIFATNGTIARPTRWFLNYEHKYELPGGFSQKTLLNAVSDIWYPKDFSMEMPGQGDPSLENRISLSRNTEATHSSIEAAYYINMLRNDPIAPNDAVHRWPEIRFSYAERPFAGSKLLAGLNLNYVNFAREGLGFDDVSWTGGVKKVDPDRTENGTAPGPYNSPYSGGVFDPKTDFVRTGQRLDLKPLVAYPFTIGRHLDVFPSIQFRHTQYAFNVSSPNVPYDVSPSRSYALGRISARTRFFKVYGLTTEASPDAAIRPPPASSMPPLYRHEVMPEVVATYLPYLTQPSNHPFLAQGAQVPIFLEDVPVSNTNFFSDPTSMQFDYNDRLATRTTVSLLITNRLVRKRWLNGSPEYKQIASWRLGQSYDFQEASRTDNRERLPFGDIQSLLDLHFDRLDLNSTLRYYPYHRVTNSISYVRFKTLDEQRYFQIDFAQSFKITENPNFVQKNADAIKFSLGLTSRYLDLTGAIDYTPQQYDPVVFKLNSWGTDFTIKPPGNCWGIKFHYQQTFTGDVEYKVDFNYNFGGTG